VRKSLREKGKKGQSGGEKKELWENCFSSDPTRTSVYLKNEKRIGEEKKKRKRGRTEKDARDASGKIKGKEKKENRVRKSYYLPEQKGRGGGN